MITAAEYAVYSAVCRTDLFNWDAPGKTFADETVSDRITQAPLKYLGGLFGCAALKHQNCWRTLLPRTPSLEVGEAV